MKRRIVFLFSCLIALMAFGFLGFGKNQKDALAVVGKDVITLDQLNQRISSFPQNYQSALNEKDNKEKVLDQMIDELLLYQAAQSQGYEKSEEFKNQLSETKKQILISLLVRDKIDNNIAVTEEDLREYYNDNSAQFQAIEQRNVRHILVKTEKEAKNILRKLKKGKNFESLAKTKSIDPTAKNGGELGWFTRGQLVPEFEKAAFELKKKGGLSNVIKTQFGYHVLKLIDMKTRPEIPFDKVKNQIQQTVSVQKKQKMTLEYVSQLKEKYKISKNAEKLN